MSSFFFDALLWPAYHLYKATQLPVPPSPSSPGGTLSKSVSSSLDILGHLSVVCGAVRAYILSYLVIFYVSPLVQPGGVYPAFEGAESFNWSWMTPIVARNVVATWVICGFWDWFLYFSPLKERLAPYKMNTMYPPLSQWRHDVWWTTVASLMASVLEIAYCYCVCNNMLAAPPPDELFLSWGNVAWVLLITHWRVPHFYVIHRLMHPWRPARLKGILPDIGKVLYRYVHSLHHKSHNPTAFSGTSMHPIESLLYYSAAGIAVLGGRHCSIVLACVIDCAVGAWLGHDGFSFPGSGDEFHQLHHAHFDCNYGTCIDSIDSLMGTAATGKDDVKKIWRIKKSK